MNRVYRIVFNRSTGQFQVAHEKAHGRGGPTSVDHGLEGSDAFSPCLPVKRLSQDSRVRAPAGAVCRKVMQLLAIVGTLSTLSSTVSADGGAGGTADAGLSFSFGGTGGTTSNPSGGAGASFPADDDYGAGGGGGGGVDYVTGVGGLGGVGGVVARGPRGGSGGAAASAALIAGAGDLVVNRTGSAGGAGGTGSADRYSAGGGGGGEGGAAVLVQVAADVRTSVEGTMAGGSGGAGGGVRDAGSYWAAMGGSGGGGGAGLILSGSGNASITGASSIAGGSGGVGGGGGNSNGQQPGRGGNGGSGGIGLVLAGGSVLSIGPQVRIEGGVGAVGGLGGLDTERLTRTASGRPGAGGVGLFAFNAADISNSGTIAAGAGNYAVVLNGGSLTHAGTIDGSAGSALLFQSGANTLAWNASGVINGRIVVAANAAATVRMAADATHANAIAFDGNLTLDTGGHSVAMNGLFSGAGSLTKIGSGTLTLGSDNSYRGDTRLAEGTLAISRDAQLGSGSLEFYGGTLRNDAAISAVRRAVILNSGGGTFDNQADLVLDGNITGDGRLTKTGNGTLTLAGFNTYEGGTRIASGIVRTTSNGLGAGPIGNDGQLFIDQPSDFVNLPGVISGTGSLTKTGAGTLSLAAGSSYSGGTTILAGRLFGTATSFGSNGIVNQGELQINENGNALLNNAISGAGRLIKTGDGTLTLNGSNTFTGGTLVQRGALAIDADSRLGNGAGVLTLDGGTLQATGSVSLQRSLSLGLNGGTLRSDGEIQVFGSIGGAGKLTVSGALPVTLRSPNTYDGGTRVIDGTRLYILDDTSLGSAGRALELDNGSVHIDTPTPLAMNRPVLLGPGGGTFANRGELTVNGVISGNGAFTKTSGGTLVLTGTNTYAGGTLLGGGNVYGHAKAFGSGDIVNNTGLKLTEAVDAEMANNISGMGDIEKYGAGALRLSGSNTYAGATGIREGALVGTARSFGGVGPISIYRLASLVIDQPDDAALENPISAGEGRLVKTGAGALTLAGANNHSGGTALKQGRIDVGNDRSLGDGELAMDDGTVLGIARDGLVIGNDIRFTGAADPIVDTGAFNATLAGAISGAADLSKQGSGTLTLTGANSYSGATTVEQGTLKAGAINTFSAASAHTVNAGATLDLAGFNQSVAGLANSGLVSLAGAAPGTTLTVTGPFVGSNGTLRLSSALGDNASAMDRLILSGPAAIASGRTNVQIVNAGGLGALTSGNGIEVISAVNGATTTAQTTRDAFVLANGHVDAGAFEYQLRPGNAQGAGENWYLRSTTPVAVPPVVSPPPPSPPVPVLPAEPGAPPAPVPAPAPAPAPVQAPAPVIELPSYRAEVPLFAALPEQVRQSQRAMLATLHQRMGDDETSRGAEGSTAASSAADGGSPRRAWARILSTDRNIRQGGTVTPHSDGRLAGLQGGTDLWASGGWRAGIYAGQLEGDFDVDGFARGTYANKVGSSKLRSQYLGGYATWTGDGGLYVDAVLQGARHRFDLRPVGNPAIKGKANGIAASVEVGQPFRIADAWSIEPQLQLLHERLSIKDALLGTTRVQSDAHSSLTARVGVRIKGDIATPAGRLQPYARLNFWRSKQGTDTTRFATPAAATGIGTRTGGSTTEAAVGATLALSANTSLYAEVGKSWASGGDTRTKSSIQGSVGLKVRW